MGVLNMVINYRFLLLITDHLWQTDAFDKRFNRLNDAQCCWIAKAEKKWREKNTGKCIAIKPTKKIIGYKSEKDSSM